MSDEVRVLGRRKVRDSQPPELREVARRRAVAIRKLEGILKDKSSATIARSLVLLGQQPRAEPLVEGRWVTIFAVACAMVHAGCSDEQVGDVLLAMGFPVDEVAR